MNIRGTLFLLGLLLISGAGSAQHYGQKWAPLVMDPPRQIRQAAHIGPKPLTDVLHLSIGLTCPDMPGLQSFADSVSNPKSSNYGHFIAPGEVGRRFGLSASNVKKVSDYLLSRGMTVRLSAKNRLSILADATVAQAQAAFNTSIEEYLVTQPKGKQPALRFAFTTAPSVPTALAPFVTVIGGLEDVNRPKPMGTLTPDQLRTLYGVAPIYRSQFQGQGRTVAISNWDGYRLSNIGLMYEQWSLPVPSGGVGSNVSVVSIDGQNGNTDSYQGEGDIDIQCVLAMAPLCNLVIYDNSNQSDYIGVLTQEADDNTADIISESYGWTEDAATFAQTHAIHLSMTAQGITYMSASGDSGADGVPSYPYPDTEPENLLVGGTSVTVDGLGNRTDEAVWNNSIGAGGGGWAPTTDPFNTLPSWQKGNGVPTNIPYRLGPDISLDADPDTGYDIFMGGQLEDGWGGTSCASPTFAGSLADAEQQLIAAGILSKNSVGKQRMGRIQDLLYSYNGDPGVFFDVTEGTNGTLPDGTASNAAVGWDTATGWGAPNLNGLVDKILGIPIPTSFTIAPATVLGGASAIGTLTINMPAPAAGLVFDLSADTSDVTLPATVKIPAGATSTTFTIGTFGTTSNETANFTALAGGVMLKASLNLTATGLASLAISPNSVVGGSESSGTVTLNGAAAVGGYDIALTSSDPSVSVPQNVEIAAGALSDTFSIDTSAVTSVTTVTITATYNGISVSSTITVSPGGLQSFTVAPKAIPTGTSAAATVTISSAAPTGGLIVNLSSNSPAATVPATVTIPAGGSSATFTVATHSVSVNTPVALGASLGGSSLTANITVTVANLTSISVAPATLLGGNSAVGTVTLSGVATGSAVTVALSSSSGSVIVPGSAVVPVGSSTTTFAIQTKPVSATTSATITGKQGANAQSVTLTVKQPAVSSLSVTPSSVTGGSSATGTVALNGIAPTGGASVSLSSNGTSAAVPATVVVPAGATSTTFSISTTDVSSDTTATIVAASGGSAQSATLTVLTPLLQSVSVSPSSITGGNSVIGTITLSRAAPSGGVSISLQVIGGPASVPASVTIPSAASGVTFTVNTSGVSASSTATITAALGGTNASTTLVIQPAVLTGFTVSPTAIVGGNAATGTVTLSGFAPSGGLKVMVSTDSTDATVPVSVTIPSGASSASFSVTTKAVVASVTVTMAAKSGAVALPAYLTVQPAGLASVSVSSGEFVGGSNHVVTGTVTFSGPVPLSGAIIKLTSSNTAAVAVPASVRILGGKLAATFAVTHRRVNTTTQLMITATYKGVSRTAQIILDPFKITAFVIAPSSVVGGKTAVGTVTLNAAPGAGAGSIAVKLASSSKAVVAPVSVVVLNGKTSANVTLRTTKVTATQTATVTASFTGSSSAASLTVTH